MAVLARRMGAFGLSLVLLFGIGGASFAADPAMPAVKTDPVPILDPVLPAVQTDPVHVPPKPPPIQLDIEIVTLGTGLVGTYTGSPGAVRYIPAFQYQLIYSDPQRGYSCTSYSAAMAVDKATYGGSRVTGRQLRALSGVAPYTGISLPEIIRGTDRLYVPIVTGTGTWADVMSALRQGRGVILQGHYSVIPDSLSGQLGFKGNHAVFIDHIGSTGRLYMMDPLQKVGARWVDESLMRAFAEKLARIGGVYPRVFYAVTRPVRLFR